ncbi:cobalamin-binding protein, partial [Bordetella bronchiseptica]
MSAARLAPRLIALTVAALAAPGAAGAAPVRVVDDQRRTVELAQPARRAIAL